MSPAEPSVALLPFDIVCRRAARARGAPGAANEDEDAGATSPPGLPPA